MIKKIVAIGGGENGRPLEDGTYAPYNTKSIDEEIVRLTGKKNPNYLFINHAMNLLEIQESYFNTMKKIYGDIFNCNCKHLNTNDLNNKDLVEELVEWADIIYEGGGDTSYMMDLWRKTGFDKVLYNAWNKGKVICGISAGAVCYFNSCNSDYENGFESVDCLNWFNYYITPHSNEEGRIESTKELIKDTNKIAILLSNCSAIEIIDNNYKILTSEEDTFVEYSYWKDNKYYQVTLPSVGNINNIKDLID